MLRTIIPVLLALGALAALSPSALADRTVSRKAPGQRVHGARPDIFVPYHTNGYGTLGVYQGVQPIIMEVHGQDNEQDAQLKPVWNLIFYGSKLQPGNSYNGPQQRKPNVLRPNRQQRD